MKHNISILILLSAALTILINCKRESEDFSPDNYYAADVKDSLLVNMVTYIGKKPRLADYQTRHNQEHRKFYIQQSENYRLVYYYITDHGTHYYYMIRPARSPRGNTRGVGGRFRMKEPLMLYDFEELFNTPILDEQELSVIGKTLFREMLNSGNLDLYMGNKDYIEWPDERLRYDKIRNEWRDDVVY